MYVKNYFYKSADLKLDNKSMIISDTKDKRDEYMSEVFYELYKDEFVKFKTTGKTAMLYCAGTVLHHSHSRIFPVDVKNSNNVIKSHTSYMASKIAKKLENISYLNINANTCASSMYAIYEAKMLLKNGFDDVIIYGEEWVENVELLLFKQFNIDLVCSDGFFILHLSNNSNSHKGHIQNPTWLWNDDRGAFFVSCDGYKKAMLPFVKSDIDLIKMHGTGTSQNDKAEYEAIKELFGDIETIEYKSQIGHSQGCSTGVELCMLLDNYKDKNILVNASGLGNFYGSFRVVI